jgi:uncharacterized protein YbaR (Trm112 family)
MKKELMDIICCPTCKTDLTLSIQKEEKDEVIHGKLKCQKCNVSYDIEDGIPNLLPKKPK